MKLLKYSNLIFFIWSLMILSSCGTLKVSNASKTKTIPGLSSQKPYQMYNFNLKSKTGFTFKNLKLVNGSEEKTISSYSFINNSTQMGSKITKKDAKFEAGNYSFNFQVNEADKQANEQYIIIDYQLTNEKLFSKRLKVNALPDKVLK